MRTTVTLDADVAAEIERIRKAEGRRFKHVLNDALRAGLKQLSGSTTSPSSAPATTPLDLGENLIDLTSTSRALALAEGDDRR